MNRPSPRHTSILCWMIFTLISLGKAVADDTPIDNHRNGLSITHSSAPTLVKKIIPWTNASRSRKNGFFTRFLGVFSLFDHERLPQYAHCELIANARTRYAFWEMVNSFKESQPFSGFEIYLRLHLTETTCDFIKSLIECGVKPQQIYGVSKFYSEDPTVLQQIQGLGCPFSHFSADSKQDCQLLSSQLLERARLNAETKFMVIDDGGEVLAALETALAQPGAPQLGSRLVAVEQTAGGLYNLRPSHRARDDYSLRHHYPCYIVNLAGAWGKTIYEPPMIGRSLANSIVQTARDLSQAGVAGLNPALWPSSELLVVGMGRVGQACSHCLKEYGFKVSVADVKFAGLFGEKKKRQLHTKLDMLGIEPSRRYHNYFSASDARNPKYVICATGETDVLEHDPQAPQGSRLIINGGSENREFRKLLTHVKNLAAENFYQGKKLTFNGQALDLARLPPSPNGDARLNTLFYACNDLQYLFPYGGQPINFNHAGKIPPLFEQYIRGLMFLGALKGALIINNQERLPSELHDELFLREIPKRLQRQWVKDVQKEIKDAGLGSLENPQF